MRNLNALKDESSPYLLQHAHNPVNWFPWGDEAFGLAKKQNKPIFLSIGYSTCHWCHVMERESFDDEEVAAALNRDYVCIKVDREQRPDIDAIYMNVCVAMTGGGGWPLTVFMTPQQKPFLAGTYFPKHSRYGQLGLLEMLSAVADGWRRDAAALIDSAEKIISSISQHGGGEGIVDASALESAAISLARSLDRRFGGFGRPPKFPMPHNLLFLLRCGCLGIGRDSLHAAEVTLDGMYLGGIFDHIGGGFSRYSTDEKWLVPHFEKMLYDNALLTLAYLEGFRIIGKPAYRYAAKRTIDYVRSEMTGAGGCFYSAQDADSEGEEGKFYTFTPGEIAAVIGSAEFQKICREYDITAGGNFEGKNVPNRIGNTAEPPSNDILPLLDLLRDHRAARYHLGLDDKVLTSWNALMISACARAYAVLGNHEYLDMAQNAYRFIRENMTSKNGRLMISWRGGTAAGDGLLDDYAFLALACIELYEATFECAYLEHACRLMDLVSELFGDAANSGYYLSAHDGETLIYRPKEWHDGAMPSGNSATALCLARLASLTAEVKWRDACDRQLSGYGAMLSMQPTSATFALLALMQSSLPSAQLVCVCADERQKTELTAKLRSIIHPQVGILVKTPDNADALARIAPFTASYPSPASGVMYYLCQNGACSAPTGDFSAVFDALQTGKLS